MQDVTSETSCKIAELASFSKVTLWTEFSRAWSSAYSSEVLLLSFQHLPLCDTLLDQIKDWKLKPDKTAANGGAKFTKRGVPRSRRRFFYFFSSMSTFWHFTGHEKTKSIKTGQSGGLGWRKIWEARSSTCSSEVLFISFQHSSLSDTSPDSNFLK